MQQETGNRRPNVLFLLSDQHNPDFLSCAGNLTAHTPNLDRLAHEGVRLTNAYCQQPLCVPSRMSMLTGRYCKDLGIYDNRDILPANSPTFARCLSEHGYRTALIGKAHMNGDQYQGYQERPYGDLFGQAHQPDPCRLPENYDHGLGDIVTQSGPSRIPLPLTQTEVVVAESCKWLQDHVDTRGGQPFLLSVHFDKPHFPINPPAAYLAAYEGNVELPSHWDDEHGEDHLQSLVPFVRSNFVDEGYYRADRELHQKTLEAYYGCVEWVDDAVGRILSVLEYLDLASDTVVIYASDHGDMAGAHGAWQKMVFFEESARVPFIIRIPGAPEFGTVRDGLVELTDVFPTLCELAGISPPADLRGTSMIPLLNGQAEHVREYAFSESVLINKPELAGCMVRWKQWKYAFYLDGTEELYNLREDPRETRNVSADPGLKNIRDHLHEHLVRFWEPDEQLRRYQGARRMPFEKHFFPYSNQFCVGAGRWFNGRP